MNNQEGWKIDATFQCPSHLYGCIPYRLWVYTSQIDVGHYHSKCWHIGWCNAKLSTCTPYIPLPFPLLQSLVDGIVGSLAAAGHTASVSAHARAVVGSHGNIGITSLLHHLKAPMHSQPHCLELHFQWITPP